MVKLNRRKLMASSVAAALGASVVGMASAEGVPESDTVGSPSVKGSLKRFATQAFGAEVTGPFVFADGTPLYSLQHPSEENPEPFGRGAVGYFSGFQFQFDGSNDDFDEVGIPETKSEQRRVRSDAGDYEILIRGREPIQGGDEQLGVSRAPDGTDLTEFAGSGGGYGDNPDCNQFVPTNDAGTEGYLFTNWENRPGCISRVPLSQDDDTWSAATDEAINLTNTEAFRALGGTWRNCYGDLTPWGTMISAEENGAHTRVSYEHTVGDIVESGTGAGKIGISQFWNRPNPNRIDDSVSRYAENGHLGEDFSIQQSGSQRGVEKLAYYLGADPVDQNDKTNVATTPIGDVYPNPYRIGCFVDIRDPAGDPPTPVKYWMMGRAKWETPDIQGDRKTVYSASDGDFKGVYKFVADEAIDSYDDTDDIAGSLYVSKITNDVANASESGSRNSPVQVPLKIEWLELGHATNGEAESWIAEYDDITQVDYLETHASTDWQENAEAAIREADLEVIANGNQNYITNEEIVEWADQYEKNGPNGVDEELQKVPFLETRAAAKEVGGTVEFKKAEGIDSVDDTQPGDFVYFAISDFGRSLADGTGDVQMDRVDGGVVYRGELDSDYDISTLEPVIVGPDSTDGPAAANDALRSVDNVYAMRDGRVLCCEDGFGGPARSYPNDCMYVYQPNVMVDVASMAVTNGKTGSVPVEATSLPSGVSGAKFTVSVSNPDVATIEGVQFVDTLGLTESSVANDGSMATLRFADTKKEVQGGGRDVQLASLDVRAESTGTTDLTVEIKQMDSESGESIEAEGRMGVFVTGPQNIGDESGSAPEDIDNDRLYEDINGNGRLDHNDVQLLFENFDSESVRMNKSAYDFNENGQLDYDDIATLYQEVNQADSISESPEPN